MFEWTVWQRKSHMGKSYTMLWNPLPAIDLFHWAVILTGLSVFTAAELQGMSPLMRGEQANWGSVSPAAPACCNALRMQSS